MSYQNQVANKLKFQSFSNILRRSPIRKQALDIKIEEPAFELQSNDCSIDLNNKANSNETANHALTNNKNVVRSAGKLNLAVTERKLKRKSFFEHICSDASPKSDSHEFKPIARPMLNQNVINKKEINNDILNINVVSPSSVTTKSNISLDQQPFLGANKTPVGNTQDCDKKLYRSNTDFPAIKIKKACITRKASQIYEFVPLASPTTTTKSDLSKFGESYFLHQDRIDRETMDLANYFRKCENDWDN